MNMQLVFICRIYSVLCRSILRYGKMGNKKTCNLSCNVAATNELYRVLPPTNQTLLATIRLLTGLNEGGKTRLICFSTPF